MKNNLPQAMSALIDATDLDTACRLVQAWGGVRIYIPQSLPKNHALISLLGEARAEHLISMFRGESLDIPRCMQALRALRNSKIRQDRESGTSPSELARHYGLTERQVYFILADRHNARTNVERVEPQGDLFGNE